MRLIEVSFPDGDRVQPLLKATLKTGPLDHRLTEPDVVGLGMGGHGDAGIRKAPLHGELVAEQDATGFVLAGQAQTIPQASGPDDVELGQRDDPAQPGPAMELQDVELDAGIGGIVVIFADLRVLRIGEDLVLARQVALAAIGQIDQRTAGLGQPVVVWRERHGGAIQYDDRCCHRGGYPFKQAEAGSRRRGNRGDRRRRLPGHGRTARCGRHHE